MAATDPRARRPVRRLPPRTHPRGMHRSVPRDGFTLPAVALSPYGDGRRCTRSAPGWRSGRSGRSPTSPMPRAWAAPRSRRCAPPSARSSCSRSPAVPSDGSPSAPCHAASRARSRSRPPPRQVCRLRLFAAYGAMTVALVLAVYFSYPVLVAGAIDRPRTRAADGYAGRVARRGARRAARHRARADGSGRPRVAARARARRGRGVLPGDVPRGVPQRLHAGAVDAGSDGDPRRRRARHLGGRPARGRLSGRSPRGSPSRPHGSRSCSPAPSEPGSRRCGCSRASAVSAGRDRPCSCSPSP